MKCPSCRETLAAGTERCASCGAIVAPPLQGALAPLPRTLTPPPRSKKVEPLRDIPGLPKKERTWRDEVQERVARRRRKRTQSSLPLFEQPAAVDASERPAITDVAAVARPAPPAPVAATAFAEPARSRPGLGAVTAPVDLGPEPSAEGDFEAAALSEEELADLPLRPADPPLPEPHDAGPPEIPPVRAHFPSDDIPGFDEPLLTSDEDEDLSLAPSRSEPEPLERPARVGERAQAAAVDAGILVVLGALVLYFTGRAARVDIVALGVSWPWLASYLGFLGLFYAGYFTGTTGQTPGKMMIGLRVVDGRGRPPGSLRAAWRAAAGALGTALAGLGLIPMALDPARRALHDRLASTRVIHR